MKKIVKKAGTSKVKKVKRFAPSSGKAATGKTYKKPAKTGRTFGKWAITDKDRQEEVMEANKAMFGMKRAPEVWVKEGETKFLWFVEPEPLFMLNMYRVLVNGKFRRITAPMKGETDLFAEEMGLQPATFAVYEVIDIEGYVDKKTKEHIKNVRRFLVMTTRQHEQFSEIPVEDREAFCMRISRSSGKPVTYTMIPDTRKYTNRPNMSKIKGYTVDEIEEFYGPPNEEMQRALIARAEEPDY